jgi:hypothetical protein
MRRRATLNRLAGTMIMTWSLEPRDGGTQVTVTAANVSPGISKADHDTGMNATLTNLGRFLEERAHEARKGPR